MSRPLLPLCKCGCGLRVKRRYSGPGRIAQYATVACVPTDLRARAGYTAAQRAADRGQYGRFHQELASLPRIVTKRDLWRLCQRVRNKAWRQGYAACDQKWMRMQMKHQREAA